MQKIILFSLAILAAAGLTTAQQLDVVYTDGSLDQFSLADIDSITFGEQAVGLRGTGDLLLVHVGGTVSQFLVTDIDSLCFIDDTTMAIHEGADEPARFNLAEVDSVTFGDSSESVVSVVYAGSSVTVTNPLEGAGVDVAIDGAQVTVTAAEGTVGVIYHLSGATSDGGFKIYGADDFGLRLDGVEITNLDGPAINSQADEEITVELVGGTTSVLTDGLTYADPPDEEDQKAAFFSEGQLIVTGGGNLVINGQGDDQHGLGSDDYVVVYSGNITVASAVKDGIHTNEGFYLGGGTVDVTSGSDGVDAGDGPIDITGGAVTVAESADDKSALKCDGILTIADGTVDLTVDGDQAKGLNAVDIQLLGGTVVIEAAGDVVLEESGSGYDPSYCTAIKADDMVRIDGAQVTVTATGEASRGISTDGDLVVAAGNLLITSSGNGGTYIDETGAQDAYHGPCIKADGSVTLTAGTVVLSHSGSGGRGMSVDANITMGSAGTGPDVQITTTGANINMGWDDSYEAKAVKADSTITIDGGELVIDSADDGLKSESWIAINDGLVDIVDSYEGIEAPNLFITGGEVHVQATDDALNTTYGVGGEGDDGSNLTISGGWIDVSASGGDGIDSNGTLDINGGTVLVHGPPSQPEVGVDVNGLWRVNGGLVAVAAINSFMAEAPGSQSGQRSVRLRSNQTINAGTLIHIEDTSGSSLVTFRPERRYSFFLFSSDELTQGTSYRVFTGGTCTGTEQDGLYSGGTYSGGSLRTTFTSSGTVQTVSF